jgi:butyrate kinase
MHKILAINPGSTSTKISIFTDLEVTQSATLKHTTDEIKEHPRIWDQFDFRFGAIDNWLHSNNIDLKEFSAVATLGGLFRSLEGGVYEVNDKMLVDARANLQGEHASNLGCALAYSSLLKLIAKRM